MGLWEILLIALVVLVVAGPQRLPVIMRTVGGWVGRGRATLRGIQAELEREGEALTGVDKGAGKGGDKAAKRNNGDVQGDGQGDSQGDGERE